MTDDDLQAIRDRVANVAAEERKLDALTEKPRAGAFKHHRAFELHAWKDVPALLAEVDRLRKAQATVEACDAAWREDRLANFDAARQQIEELLRHHLPDVGATSFEWLAEGIMTFGTNRFVEGLIEARRNAADALGLHVS